MILRAILWLIWWVVDSEDMEVEDIMDIIIESIMVIPQITSTNTNIILHTKNSTLHVIFIFVFINHMQYAWIISEIEPCLLSSAFSPKISYVDRIVFESFINSGENFIIDF